MPDEVKDEQETTKKFVLFLSNKRSKIKNHSSAFLKNVPMFSHIPNNRRNQFLEK